ncbi:MAG: dockerin type I domain-containing protein [Ruminococcus flavefaciens]|nr:dockerin type I domain-containing protein [Ruminococcus flavefaciens]MCM1230610.1 dockerin type I domain-containing protein [Ruminococcus flavefaciens]
MKKFISLLTSSVLLTAVSASSAFAEETGTDYSLIINSYLGSIYHVTATNPDGTTYDPTENRNEELPKYLTYVNGAVEICVDEEAYYEDYMAKSFRVGFKNAKRDIYVENSFPGKIVINDNALTLQNPSANPYNQKDYVFDNTSNGKRWIFSSDLETDEEIKFNFADNGFIVNSTSEHPVYVDFGNDDWKDIEQLKATGNFMVTADEDNAVVLSIDPDNDGVYTAVEKGDVNNDGVVNASDASAVLAAYSQFSTGSDPIIYSYAFDYNSDGIINAADATGILSKYSESSVQS